MEGNCCLEPCPGSPGGLIQPCCLKKQQGRDQHVWIQMIQMFDCLYQNISDCDLSKLTSVTQLQRRKGGWNENTQLQEVLITSVLLFGLCFTAVL